MSSAFNIPAGFWLAPMEPNEAMLRHCLDRQMAVAIYHDMRDSQIAAAPPVDAVPGEPVAVKTCADCDCNFMGSFCLKCGGGAASVASRAQSETAEHWMHKAHEFQAERDDLRQLLDTRPALNAGLADAYRAWTGKVYAADVYRVAFAAGATPGEKQ